MYVDPPAPQPMRPGERPPATAGTDPLSVQPRAWEFNPEYQRLVNAWQAALPLLEGLTTALDKAYGLARSPQTWDAPVGSRYVEDIGEWRKRLALYRQAVLTSISDEAADTPRWIPSAAGAPHAFS
ncbi:hypothetical protein [Nonomuraea cavernae]|uniref:Uncharacterized protein n=1 Tax=Nonomuraea cavernae TaxID=2045107 RepID=A0A917Z328_9ACTN|nr:hypothetical protein [Nonomuraea cavernae]MCA2188304.1 hypothetical protein [Nonomuraea cavernae]GGO73703.1 hypothetical protein GCM10012289_44650 [Nonomuraea cavernae]